MSGVRSTSVWKAYSVATGYLADVAALSASAALFGNVSATAAGIFIAAGIIELAALVSNRLVGGIGHRLRAAATPEEEATAALAGLAIFAFTAVLMFADVAVADWLLPSFDISGFPAYVGTVALVFVASFAVYSPLYVTRRLRQVV